MGKLVKVIFRNPSTSFRGCSFVINTDDIVMADEYTIDQRELGKVIAPQEDKLPFKDKTFAVLTLTNRACMALREREIYPSGLESSGPYSGYTHGEYQRDIPGMARNTPLGKGFTFYTLTPLEEILGEPARPDQKPAAGMAQTNAL